MEVRSRRIEIIPNPTSMIGQPFESVLVRFSSRPGLYLPLRKDKSWIKDHGYKTRVLGNGEDMINVEKLPRTP